MQYNLVSNIRTRLWHNLGDKRNTYTFIFTIIIVKQSSNNLRSSLDGSLFSGDTGSHVSVAIGGRQNSCPDSETMCSRRFTAICLYIYIFHLYSGHDWDVSFNFIVKRHFTLTHLPVGDRDKFIYVPYT